MTTPDTEPTGTLAQLAQVRSQNATQAKTGEEQTTEEVIEAKTEEVPAQEVVEAAPPAPAEEDGDIKIGDRTFKTSAEAVKYAEQLIHEKEIAEAHSMGVQEALAASRVAPVAEVKEEEDFETKFYTDPKGTLKQLEESAVQKATQKIKAEQQVEDQWRMFDEENPDLAGQRSIAQLTLQENWETIGKMTDIPKARKLLATKVRAKFQEWADRSKPRTELPNRGGQVVSSGSQSVTPTTQTKKEEKPLDFAAQLRANRKR